MSQFAIEAKDLNKSFGNHQVLKNLSFNVPQKSVYGLLGNNGVGKSTTVRLLMGLLRPDQGSLSIFGKSIKDDRIAILSGIGAIIDSPSLYYNLTGREFLNITKTIKNLDKTEVDRVIELVGMRRHCDRVIANYSLGMKQRIALAQALMGNPKLLILDEPTNGLDPSGMREIRSLLRALPDETGATVFLSSHLLDEVEKTVTHIGLMRDGCLLAEGELSTFLNQQKGQLVINCTPLEDALKLLQQHNFTATLSGGHALIVQDIPKERAPQVHSLITGANIALYSSHFTKQSLEDMFHSSTSEKGEV